ncbi:hypothetical protein D3C78_1170590 [compost metagenome]
MLVVCRQLCDLLLQEGHGLAEGDVGCRNRHQGRTVELIELGQGVGLDPALQADHCRERHLSAAGCADVVAFEKLCGQALVSRRLWDDIVGAALGAEAVDVGLAHQTGKGIADFLHVQAQVVSLGAVDTYQYGGVGKGQVGVDEGEQSAVTCRGFDLLHVFIDFLVPGGRRHHQLHRKTTYRSR